MFEHIPGPKEFPLVGNLFALKRDELGDFDKFSETFSCAPISKFVIFNQVFITINDPSIVQQIFTSPYFHKRPSMLKFFEMESALFTSQCNEKFYSNSF